MINIVSNDDAVVYKVVNNSKQLKYSFRDCIQQFIYFRLGFDNTGNRRHFNGTLRNLYDYSGLSRLISYKIFSDYVEDLIKRQLLIKDDISDSERRSLMRKFKKRYPPGSSSYRLSDVIGVDRSVKNILKVKDLEMLEENKKLFANNADLLPGWRDMSTSDLCRKYLELKDAGDPLLDSCLSAIVYRFWHIMNYNYYIQNMKLANEMDCYDWNIDAILYVLDKHVWTDPKSNLYNDPNGPEKAISVAISSGKTNFFVGINRDKRKLSYGTLSLDFLQEESSDGFFIPYNDKDETYKDVLQEKIKEYFSKKDYFPAFVLDNISHDELFDNEENDDGTLYSVFNTKKLWKAIYNLNDSYATNFSELYEMDLDEVKKALSYMKQIPFIQFDNKVEKLFLELRHDKPFINCLRGEIYAARANG